MSLTTQAHPKHSLGKTSGSSCCEGDWFLGPASPMSSPGRSHQPQAPQPAPFPAPLLLLVLAGSWPTTPQPLAWAMTPLTTEEILGYPAFLEVVLEGRTQVLAPLEYWGSLTAPREFPLPLLLSFHLLPAGWSLEGHCAPTLSTWNLYFECWGGGCQPQGLPGCPLSSVNSMASAPDK